MIAKRHWQIVKHGANGHSVEGDHLTVSLSEAPPDVVDIGLRAAQLIGQGLYGVDIKETPHGIYVVEVNDTRTSSTASRIRRRRIRSGLN